tara:strand:- start:439 stop:1677 length:1239 start_codon:yes stop_codon:yes gene_type:complete
MIHFLKSNIAKNFFLLFSSSAIAQIIALLLAPFISRLFTPDNFGMIGYILSISGIFTAIGSLTYEKAIVLENDDKKAQDLQFLSLCSLFIFSIILYFSISFYIKKFSNLESSYLLWIVPIFFLNNFINIVFAVLNRDRQYKNIAMIQLLRRSGTAITQLTFGIIGYTAFGLIWGNIFGALFCVIYIFILSSVSFSKRKYKLEDIKYVAKKYINFPLYTAPQELINISFAQLPVIILANYYSITILGAYYFAVKIIQLPSALLGNSIKKIFYKEAACSRNKMDNLKELYFNLTAILFFISIIPIIISFFFAPDIFSFVFGSDWLFAGKFARWMTLWFGANFIMIPSRVLFLVFEKQKLLFKIDLIIGIIRFMILLITVNYFSAITAIATFSVISGICFIAIILGWIIFLTNKN